MASLPQILKVPSLDSSLGAVLLGVVLGSMLYGLTVHQTYRYFRLYPTDRPILKSLVLTIFVFETLHTAVWIVVIYHYAITDAFHVADILRGHWSVRLTFPITGFAVFACQSFYVGRVFRIGPCYRWLAVTALISMFVGMGFAIAAGTEAFLTTPFIVDLQHISWLVSIAYGFAVATDVILTSALVFFLYKWKSDTSDRGNSRANSIADTLILYTINTGLLTSIISMAAFIFAIVIPGNLIYAAVSIVGTKLYANSILAALNSRRSIGDRFLVDCNLGSHANGVPPRQPQREYTIELESMRYNVPEQYLSASETSTLRKQNLNLVPESEGN